MDERGPLGRIGRREVLAGLAGVGGAATGILPTVASAGSDVVLLGDFETGFDGWASTGASLLETVQSADHPGAVTRGDRGLEVTVTGDLLPTIGNEVRAEAADFLGHPYLVADVTPGLASGTGTDLTFKFRYFEEGAPVESGDALDLGGVDGVYESEETTVPPLVPSHLAWDTSGLPSDALENPERLELLWYPTEYPPEAGLEFDYEGWVVFDNVRLTDDVGELSAARLENRWRDLQLAHGHFVETTVTTREAGYEIGAFVFADGTEVPYTFEVLTEGRFRYTIDGEAFALTGPGRPAVPKSDGGSTPPSTSPGRRDASATVLTYIPGTSENTTAGGDEYDSAMPDVSDHIDNAFHADNRTALEPTLSAATELDKDLAEYSDRLFPHYRVRNGIAVSFRSTNDGAIDGPITVESSDHSTLSPITLEGEPGEGDDNPYRENLESVHGGEEWKPALPREHFVGHAAVRIDGVEGLRASTIYGGVDRYIAEYLEAKRNGGELELGEKLEDTPAPYVLDHVFALPAFYSFLELTAMADGAELVRVWDAGRYPRHALYVNGNHQGETDFHQGDEWRRNEPTNARFTQWGTESDLSMHPYKSSHLAYEHLFRAGGGSHPVLLATQDGEFLTAERVAEATPRPYFPF